MLLTVNIPNGISSLRISPRGTRLALANEEDPATAVVVALPSGKEVARIEGLERPVRMAFRSETELVLGSGPECFLYNLTRKTRRNLRSEGEGDVFYLDVSPNGKTVAAAFNYRGEELFLLDAAGKKEPRRLDLSRSVCAWVDAVRFSPDGRFLCAQCAPEEHERWMRFLVVVEAKTGTIVRLLKVPWHQLYDYPVAFRPDNRVLAMAYFEKVLLFDLFPPPSPLAPEAIFSHDDPCLDLGLAAPMARFDLAEGKVTQLRFSDEGVVLKVCCVNGDAVLLSADEMQLLRQTPAPEECRAVEYYETQIGPSGTAARRLSNTTVWVWDVPWWAEA
jgi:WD40 repeat protein